VKFIQFMKIWNGKKHVFQACYWRHPCAKKRAITALLHLAGCATSSRPWVARCGYSRTAGSTGLRHHHRHGALAARHRRGTLRRSSVREDAASQRYIDLSLSSEILHMGGPLNAKILPRISTSVSSVFCGLFAPALTLRGGAVIFCALAHIARRADSARHGR